MIKKFLALALVLFGFCTVAQAAINKIAVVDMQKVVSKSAQIQAFRKEQDNKRKELAQFIKKAGEDIKKQTDSTKKKAVAQKYDKELKVKQEANEKAAKAKIEAINKNINATIAQQAKAMGYDVVFTKDVVLYGCDDITEAVLKVVK